MPTHLSRSTTASSRTAVAPRKMERAKPRPIPKFAKGDNRKLVVTKFGYDADGEGEVTIKEGDYLRIVEEIDEGWWIGETEDGKTGMFPANYVEEVELEPEPEPEPEPQPELPKRQSSAVSMIKRAPQMPQRASMPPPRPSSNTKPTSKQEPKTMEEYVAKEAVNYAVRNPKKALAAASTIAGMGARASAAAYKTHQEERKTTAGACSECGCTEFQANVFKKGSCNNCFHKH